MSFLRFLSIVALCVFFVACGDKKVDVTQGGETENIPQQEVSSEYLEMPDEEQEIIEEYIPPKPDLKTTQLETIYFAFDSFVLSKEMFAIVNQNAELLKQYPNAKIVLEGNTDAYGSDEYNFALGNKRALAVKEALLVRGIAQSQIEVVSFGETKPACIEDDSEECRQKNRRVDFVLR